MTSTTDALPDFSDAYRELHLRVDALVRAATPEQCSSVAPATPEWRVHDLLAHLVGVPADILAGRLENVASDAWTEAQVAPRRDLPTVALLEEWSETSPQVEPMIPSFGPVAGQMVGDAVTHEHDIRDALDAPGARDSTAVHIGSHWMANHMGNFHRDAGHGTLRIDRPLERDVRRRRAGHHAASECLRPAARVHRTAQRRPDRGVRLGRPGASGDRRHADLRPAG